MVAHRKDYIVVILTPVTCLAIESDRIVTLKGLLAIIKKLHYINYFFFCSFSMKQIISIENRKLNILYNNQKPSQHAAE